MIESKNDLQQVKKDKDSVSFTFFYFIILIQTLLFTSFSSFFPQFSNILAKLGNLLIILYVLYSLVVRMTVRRLIYTLITLSIILVTFWYSKNFSPYLKLLLLSVAVPATIPSAKNICKVFGISMVTTMIITIFFSLLGYLPKSGTTSKSIFSDYQETVYFLGFNHPNAFGTFLSILFAILAFLFYEQHKWRVVLIAPIFFLINIGIGAGTAAVSIVLITIILILPIKLKKIYKVLYILPSAFTLFSLWLSYHNTSNLGNIINEKIAARPNVWNAYVTQYPMGLVNLPPQINNSGFLGILGNGVLDGSYIYILIFWGILAWLVYNWIFIALIKFSIDTNSKVLFGIALSTIITAFPESHVIMFYENVFLLFVGFYQYSTIERKKCLEL